jgi:hypothetical protein
MKIFNYNEEIQNFKELVNDVNIIGTKDDIILYMDLVSMRYNDRVNDKLLQILQKEFERIYDMERQN